MSSGARVTFNDPRRFGFMMLVPRAELADHPLMQELGPEPLGNAFDAALLAQACRGKKTSLKAALLDQTVVAGLGNIYVCEALHRAQLSPKRMASTIATASGAPNERAERLVDAIKAVLERRDQGGRLVAARPSPAPTASSAISSITSASTTAKASQCATPGCKGTVKRIVQGGRSTFFCPVCQK